MKIYSFRLDDETKELIKKYAKKTRQSKSRFIREAIIEKIKGLKLEEKESGL